MVNSMKVYQKEKAYKCLKRKRYREGVNLFASDYTFAY